MNGHIRKYGTRSNYTQQTLEEVLKNIKSGEMSMASAVKIYGIPKSTLAYKLKRKHDKKIGKPTVFSDIEENMFVQHILAQTENAMPMSLVEFRLSVRDYLNQNERIISTFTDNMPGDGWGIAFLDRHPIIRDRLIRKVNV